MSVNPALSIPDTGRLERALDGLDLLVCVDLYLNETTRHADDAERIGLADGGRARVVAETGAIEIAVERTKDVMPGVVSIPHGWGHGLPGTKLAIAAQKPGVNSNRLAGAELMDPVSGNAVLNGVPVGVEPLD